MSYHSDNITELILNLNALVIEVKFVIKLRKCKFVSQAIWSGALDDENTRREFVLKWGLNNFLIIKLMIDLEIGLSFAPCVIAGLPYWLNRITEDDSLKA